MEDEAEATPLTRKDKAKGYWQRAKKKRTEDTVKSQILNFVKKRERQVIDNTHYELFPMCGYDVKLPKGIQPYPTQKLMMVKILSALKLRQNVIAESPTGSGKTLALLASCCAWILKYNEKRAEARSNCAFHNNGNTRAKENEYEVANEEELPEEDLIDIPLDDEPPLPKMLKAYEDELNKDFTPCRTPSLPSTTSSMATSTQKTQKKEAPPVCTCLPRARIYYGTRTHKQIGQVVKEFRRLPYAGVIRHTIMASREQSCINEQARKAHDITGYCKELLTNDGLGCIHKTNIRSHRLDVPNSMRKHVEMHGETVFDIEDLVDAMKVSRPTVCPYFASTRILTTDADIVFTPFTYLVDPIIRNSSDVTLQNSVVILDEAHNIEDTCREGASFTFHEKELAEALYAFTTKERLAMEALSQSSSKGQILFGAEAEFLEKLTEFIKSLGVLTKTVKEIYAWFKEIAEPLKKLQPDKFSGAKVENKGWAYLAHSLDQKKLLYEPNSPGYEILKESLDSICAPNAPGVGGEEETKSKLVPFVPNGAAIVMVEKWLYFLDFFGIQDNRNTYRLNITMEQVSSSTPYASSQYSAETKFTGQGPKNAFYNNAEAIWMDSSVAPHGMKAICEGFKTSVSLWCMSPALTFMDSFKDVHSIILASGTLCPMGTLKTELGTDFKVEVEGKQVIAKERIFASVLKVGPSYVPLQLTTKQFANNPRILPEIVGIIKDICLSVPKGILCFMPSYKMLQDISNYMRTRRIDSEIGARKLILEEPRRSGELNSVMNSFEDAMRDPKQFGAGVDGVLMLAVFRGKISEGIDFTDDKARVVISLGIPYPNWGDSQVQEKRRYNDENAVAMGILRGDDWYTTQAYRALNQALGRCLRHKNDWGALVLVDDRLTTQATNTHYGRNARAGPSSAQVSRWIRDQLHVYEDYSSFSESLIGFVERMTGGVKESPRTERVVKTKVF